MAFVSKHRTARISPTKVRPVVNQIRRRQIDQAIMLMQMSKRRGAHFVRQVLETAKANAVQHGDLSTQDAGLVAGELRRVVKEEQRLREEERRRTDAEYHTDRKKRAHDKVLPMSFSLC